MLGYMVENIRCGDCDVVEPDEVQDLGVPVGRCSTCGPRASSGPERYRGASTLRSTSCGSHSTRWARARSSSTAKWVSVVTLRRCSSRRRDGKARNLDGGYRTWPAAEAARLGRTDILDR